MTDQDQASIRSGFLITAASFVVVVAGMKAAAAIVVPFLLSVPLTMFAKIALEYNPGTRWLAVLLGSPPESDSSSQSGDQTSEKQAKISL